ncbi:hypothetical protein CATRI_06350 [Corynebacterium atrinae]|nr:hypothetical protein CATRI_06350 [Corynebacterium atrinae]
MIKISLGKLKSPGGEVSVSVADVERIRRQRRQVMTEAEQADVRMHLRNLVGDIQEKPSSNARYLKNTGIALIAIGLIIGLALFYAADLAWRYYY